MKQRDALKILLLQIRDDAETCHEEHHEFVSLGHLQPEQLVTFNTFQTPHFAPTIIDDYDALFVGGSSDASVLDPITYPFIDSCKRLLRYCYEKHIPVLASCFGFQVVIEELGGKVILDKANMEMGIYPIKLTEAAKHDALLYDIDDNFPAVSGHKERAVQIPEDAILLGHTPACPYHMIKFKDKPFYGFQFHPEVSRADLITRITRYQTRYLEDAAALDAVIQAATQETTQANDLVAKFIDRIILST